MGSRPSEPLGVVAGIPTPASPNEHVRGLLEAVRAMTGSADVSVLLRAIIAEAFELVEADYAAVSLTRPDGGLEQFIRIGGDDDLGDRIERTPQGSALVAALTTRKTALRWDNVSADPSAAHYSQQRAALSSFLGVPIRVRGQVFAILYLADAASDAFSTDDEGLVSALAAGAAVVIENMWLFDESRMRQQWLDACAEITRQLLSDDDADPLSLIAQRTLEAARADLVNVVLPSHSETTLMVDVAAGEGARELTGRSFPMAKTLSGLAIATGQAVRVSALTDLPEQSEYGAALSRAVCLGALMAIPLAGSQPRGALVVGRLSGRHPFSDADLTMATMFADYAAVGLELADTRRRQGSTALFEDRSRIARDLHDHVIQRLYAAGLTVQSVTATALDSHVTNRLSDVIDEIDAIIDHIRATIQVLGQTPHL